MDNQRVTDKSQNPAQTRASGMQQDIISTILEDHKPLKELIKVMKDSEKPFDERKQAFADFAPLLVTHATAEERSLYEFMKQSGEDELKTESFEGQTEHNLADQLVEEIKRTTDQQEMSAKIKVLAELVEHHIEEEEDEMFPEIKKDVDKADLLRLNGQYLQFMEEIIAQGQDNALPEQELTSQAPPTQRH